MNWESVLKIRIRRHPNLQQKILDMLDEPKTAEEIHHELTRTRKKAPTPLQIGMWLTGLSKKENPTIEVTFENRPSSRFRSSAGTIKTAIYRRI
jgi:hypothetical protein